MVGVKIGDSIDWNKFVLRQLTLDEAREMNEIAVVDGISDRKQALREMERISVQRCGQVKVVLWEDPDHPSGRVDANVSDWLRLSKKTGRLFLAEAFNTQYHIRQARMLTEYNGSLVRDIKQTFPSPSTFTYTSNDYTHDHHSMHMDGYKPQIYVPNMPRATRFLTTLNGPTTFIIRERDIKARHYYADDQASFEFHPEVVELLSLPPGTVALPSHTQNDPKAIVHGEALTPPQQEPIKRSVQVVQTYIPS